MENMDLWEQVEKTPKEHTKPITGKAYKGTSPKPHYLVQKATETFGPCGIGWGFSFTERVEFGAGDDKVHIAHIKVWYKWDGERGEVEHVGQTMLCGKRKSGDLYTDEDAPKKSVTDGLIKALSMIGFAGDIFMGRYDDSKYVQELENEAKQEADNTNFVSCKSNAQTAIENMTSVEEVRSWLKDVLPVWRSKGLDEAQRASLTKIAAARVDEIKANDNNLLVAG